jgi:hypothetical protein
MFIYTIENRFSPDDHEYTYNNTDGIIVPVSLWTKWINSCSCTMIVRLSQENSQICTVGGYHNDDDTSIYAPAWMFYLLQSGKEVKLQELWIENTDEEFLALATKIYLKPLDNEIYHADIEEEISEYLGNFQCLQKGSTLIVPIKKLGGYKVDIFVEKCEPDNEVIVRGEVALELIEPLETIPEWSKSSPPIPDDSHTWIPKTREPREDDSESMLPISSDKKFVAFSGKGYTM